MTDGRYRASFFQVALLFAIVARLGCVVAFAQSGTAEIPAVPAAAAQIAMPLSTPAKADVKPAELMDPKVGSDWVRIKYDDKDKNKPLAMQTAIVRYSGQIGSGGDKHDVSIDLIGAVHVGDESYYDELNRQFTQYDSRCSTNWRRPWHRGAQGSRHFEPARGRCPAKRHEDDARAGSPVREDRLH